MTVLESARLGAGLAYALLIYFGRASAPAPAVTRAGRIGRPLRAGGLVLAGLGHRDLAPASLTAGSAWSMVAVARALSSVS